MLKKNKFLFTNFDYMFKKKQKKNNFYLPHADISNDNFDHILKKLFFFISVIKIKNVINYNLIKQKTFCKKKSYT